MAQLPWSRRILWSLLAPAGALLAAASFLAFEAARGVAFGFAVELALAAAAGLVMPLLAVAGVRRFSTRQPPALVVFSGAALAIAVLLFLLAWML